MNDLTPAARIVQLVLTPPFWCLARVCDLVDWLQWQTDQVMDRVSRSTR